MKCYIVVTLPSYPIQNIDSVLIKRMTEKEDIESVLIRRIKEKEDIDLQTWKKIMPSQHWLYPQKRVS